MTSDSDGTADPNAVVAAVLTATDVPRDALPTLLGLLDTGDRQVRLGAATALCAVADAHPDTVAYLVGRLLDRTNGDDGLAADLALDYLAARFPETVETELDALTGEGTARHRAEQSRPTGRRLEKRNVGRIRVAGTRFGDDPRQVYPDDPVEETGERNQLADGDEETNPEQSVAGSESTVADADEDEGGTDNEARSGRTIGRRPAATDAEWLSLVEYESRFDALSILAPREHRRYGVAYRTLGVADDEEHAVALRLLHTADTERAFETALASRLDDWAAVSKTDNVVTLYDWDEEPRHWLATEYTDLTLAERGRFTPTEAAWQAERLANAVTALHEHGVVHTGIDPTSISYYGNVLRDGDRQPPLLNDVGLVDVYRQYTDPAQFLDPRYAAPEYYERRFGRIDHATDIYQLGAVCYRLFTGRPPYTGSFDHVREQVLAPSPPAPSDVADVPAAVDDVVGKAMATRKLARYETAAHLTQELRALREPRGTDGR
ncbi:protein kinase domain-containing protein [Haloarcula amylovorans]|uniref:protein kinase domain-containing protein n=1 Tax=Haloarcula amylovorans TaxID=2562280 RepID=UPI0010760B87|nr:serine/threonine protein kinase [Halomicroarcula amylolytica]